MKKISITLGLALLSITYASAQYNKCAGQNRITQTTKSLAPVLTDDGEEVLDVNGKVMMEEIKTEVLVSSDSYGNAQGNQYDLAVDGAFEGNTIAVLFLCRDGNANFNKPKEVLKQKGFCVEQIFFESVNLL